MRAPGGAAGAALGLVVLALLLGACAGATPTARPSDASDPAGERTRVVDGGQVTVRVTWDGPAAGPVFDVVLDTHAVDLDGYDLTRLATLRTDDGREIAPASWEAPKGGHHRSGRLVFPATSPDGTALLSGARGVELLIRDVAGVPERSFRWAL
jgi:hypothetical protein